MSRYARNTNVSVEKSKAEIERVVTPYGADGFMSGSRGTEAMIAFEIKGRPVRFNLTLPNPKDVEFTEHSRGERTEEAAYQLWEQACRQRWRALLLIIKAALEAVELGIVTLDQVFMGNLVLPNQKTVAEWLTPQIEAAYAGGKMPKALPMLSGK